MNKIISIIMIALVIGGCSAVSKTPEPKWRSLRKDGNFEVRHYDSMIIAEVTVAGERYTAINNGFRILADYIFGDNLEQDKIAMTAPVMQEAISNADKWKVRFVMPQEYTYNSLPKPNDTQIEFIEVPAHRAAVVQFSGFNTDSNLRQHQAQLMDWLYKEKITVVGQPVFAFYNPPWTLPFMRRNEIIVMIEK